MQYRKIDPMDYPLKGGEAWYIAHPNEAGCKFVVPNGAVTVCLESFESFSSGIAYRVLGTDNHNGWVNVSSMEAIYSMPHYVFARHFDVQCFIHGVASEQQTVLERKLNSGGTKVGPAFVDLIGNSKTVGVIPSSPTTTRPGEITCKDNNGQ